MPKNVLVTGSTGFIGQAVVRQLLAAGYHVRALTRLDSQWPFDNNPNLSRATGDIRARSAVIAACKEMDVIVHLAAAKNDEPDSEIINVGGARNIIEGAREANVQRIINMSTQSTRIPKKGLYGATKEKADILFAAANLPVVTVRSSLVYGEADSGVFGTIIRFSSLPMIPMFGAARFRPIHRDDLAALVVKAVELPGIDGKIYDVGGREQMSLEELTHSVMDARGVRRPIVHMPIWLGLLLAHLPGSPITVSNVLGGATDVPMDTEAMMRDFGNPPLRSIKEDLIMLFGGPQEKAKKEARLLLTYALSAMQRYTPRSEEVDRYLHALHQHGLTPGLHISSLRLLCALDAATKLKYPDSPLQKKLLIAAAIAETQPSSAITLLPHERSRTAFVIELLRLSLRGLLTYIGALPLLLFPSFLRRHAGIVR